jgi:hypothetical protein
MKFFVCKKIQVLIKLCFWINFNENENNIFCHFEGPFWTLILESYSPSSHGIQGMITIKVIVMIFKNHNNFLSMNLFTPKYTQRNLKL